MGGLFLVEVRIGDNKKLTPVAFLGGGEFETWRDVFAQTGASEGIIIEMVIGTVYAKGCGACMHWHVEDGRIYGEEADVAE